MKKASELPDFFKSNYDFYHANKNPDSFKTNQD